MRDYLQVFIDSIQMIAIIFGMVFFFAAIWAISGAIENEIKRKYPRKTTRHRKLIPIWVGCGLALLLVLAACFTLVMVAIDFSGISFGDA